MAGAARVLVHVRRGGAAGPARFGQSVTGVFCAAHEDTALVNVALVNTAPVNTAPVNTAPVNTAPVNAAPVTAAPVKGGPARGHLLLSDQPFPGSTAALLKRPPCSPSEWPGAPVPCVAAGVAAGVAVLLRAGTGHVLLTRRASALSTFPSVWVPPGGHVEPGEELLDVGLRELEEETGLRLGAGTFSWRVLGLWESMYPPAPSRGPLRHHHIVTYLLLLSAESRGRLEARMRPSESEVSAYAWLEPPVLEAIAATEEGAETPGIVPSALPATISITELSGGSSRVTRVPTATLLPAAPAHGDDVERVSAGTRFALRLCLESLGTRWGAGQRHPAPQK